MATLTFRGTIWETPPLGIHSRAKQKLKLTIGPSPACSWLKRPGNARLTISFLEVLLPAGLAAALGLWLGRLNSGARS